MNHGGAAAYEPHFRAFFDRAGYQAMAALRDAGQVRAIGVGVGDWRAAQRLIEAADFDACLLAGRYTLLEQAALTTFLPLCAARGVGVVVGARYNYRPAPPEVMERVGRIERVCQGHGVAMIAAALQFPLHHPCVASVIPGMATPAEIAAAVETIAAPVPPALYQELQAQGLISPGAPIG